MRLSKQGLQSNINRIEAELAFMKKQLEGCEEKFELEMGSHYLHTESNSILEDMGILFDNQKELFNSFPSADAAQQSLDLFRMNNIIINYVAKHGGDWEADWEDTEQPKWSVNYSTRTCEWFKVWTCNYKQMGTIYMSHECAASLAEDLNSGYVTL